MKKRKEEKTKKKRRRKRRRILTDVCLEDLGRGLLPAPKDAGLGWKGAEPFFTSVDLLVLLRGSLRLTFRAVESLQ